MADTTRVTLVLPTNLWEELKRMVPSGQRSRVMAEALEAKLQQQQRREAFEHAQKVGDALAKKYGNLPSSVEEIRLIREERDAELLGVH